MQNSGRNNHTVNALKQTAYSVARMINRVASRRHGIKEEDLLGLTEALIVSRVTHATPYLNLLSTEKAQINVLLRKAYKQARGLLPGTGRTKLLSLGIHNTLEEVIEAHRHAQVTRLSLTRTGRATLRRLQ